ncbi:MAG: hypothetical protein WAV76_15985 [Bacteroidota bacterium]
MVGQTFLFVMFRQYWTGGPACVTMSTIRQTCLRDCVSSQAGKNAYHTIK